MVSEKMLRLRLLRLPSVPPRTRRLIPIITIVVVLFLLIHLYSRLRFFALNCGQGSSWTCRALSGKVRDAKPIIPPPNGMSSPSILGGGGGAVLDNVNSALEDAYYGVTDALSRPGLISGWRYERDADDVSLSRRQCMLAFPGLFIEADRARSTYEGFHITKDDMKKISIIHGRLRAAIFSGKLHVLETNLPNQKDRTRALAMLRSINQAVSRPPKKMVIPDIEFVVSVDPKVPDLTYPIWVPDRREEDDKVWLMPDPGYVVEEVEASLSTTKDSDGRRKSGAPPSQKKAASKDKGNAPTKEKPREARVITTLRKQLISDIELLESALPYEAKQDRLIGVWRTDRIPDGARQKALVRVADGQTWAESSEKGRKTGVGGIEGANRTTTNATPPPASSSGVANFYIPPLSEMCQYAFLAHDDSFGIPVIDGPLMCGSVLFTTRPKWITIYHRLMLANPDHLHLGDSVHPTVRGWGEKGAGQQNVVLVADDWADLDMKVQGLLQYPHAAAQLANNTAETFRRRYLTPSAAACYWRELILAYRRVGFKPKAYADEKDFEIADGEKLFGKMASKRGISFESFLLLDDDTQMSFNEAMMRRKT